MRPLYFPLAACGLCLWFATKVGDGPLTADIAWTIAAVLVLCLTPTESPRS